MSVVRPDTESANMEEIVFLYRYEVSTTSILPKLVYIIKNSMFQKMVFACRLIPGQTLLSYGEHF